MLSLFRHVSRRSLVAARTISLAHYSTESDSAASTKSLKDVKVLIDEAQANPENKRALAVASTPTRQGETQIKWKTFSPNRMVKPHDFTYKARYNAPREYLSMRPKLGPPPSVARFNDVFHQFDLDPVSLAMNPEIISFFVSDMGKVYGRNITGLTTKSQRRLGKAVRRAKMMGVIPVLSKSKRIISTYSTRKSSS